jgi:two-component system phosphate regulon sensor histidine kinase PhoR
MVLSLVLLVVAGIGILGIYLVNSVRDTYTAEVTARLEAGARVVARLSLPELQAGDDTAINELARSLSPQLDARLTIIAPDGIVLGDSQETSLAADYSGRPEVAAALSAGVGEDIRYDTDVAAWQIYVAVPVTAGDEVLGVVRLASPLAVVDAAVGGIVRPVSAALAIAVAVAVILALYLSRGLSRTLAQMTDVTRRLTQGEFGMRVPVKTDDELARLGQSFNEMSSNIESTMAYIAEENRKLSTVVSSMVDGVIMTDTAGNVLLANPAAEKLFGFRQDRVKARSFMEAVRDYEIDEVLRTCLHTGTEQTIQVESGVGKWFLRVIAVPLVTDRLVGALLVFQNLTELRALQTMRRELVGNISHELRTPLATIKAIVETLQDGAISDQKLTLNFLANVDTEVDRMTQIIAELTELSRIESGKAELNLSEVDLNGLVREVIAQLGPYIERQGITIDLQLSPELPRVMADKERIRQVVTNLVHNAIKFTPAGGQVTASSRQENGSVRVTIADNGIGIPQDDLPHVFERFYKADKARSSGGTGLGLAIAKHIIQAHNGTIEVASEEGHGSQFSFCLTWE